MTSPPQGPPGQDPSFPSDRPPGQQPGYGQGQPGPGYGQQPTGAMPPAPAAGFGPPPHPAGPYADMVKRFLARLLDFVILGIPLFIVLFVIGFATATDDGTMTAGGTVLTWVISIVVPLAYEIGLIATRGATIGKQIIGVKVVREADGQVPGVGPAALRWLIPFLGSFVCGIGALVVYLSPFFDSSGKRQGWHDKAAKTVVVATK